LLLDVETTAPAEAQRLHAILRESLAAMVNDLDLYCDNDQQKFTDDFKRLATAIFTRKNID